MSYREPASPPEPPRAAPTEVFTLQRYGRAWLAGAISLAVAGVAAGALLWSTTTLVCARPIRGEWATCALETRRVIARKREPVRPMPSAIEAKVIEVGTEGSPHQLGVQLEDLQIRWFQLGEAGNARVAGEYRAFILSAKPGRVEATLAGTGRSTLVWPLLGVGGLLLLLFFESWDRFELWAEGGRLRLTSRRRLFRRRTTTFALEQVDRFEVAESNLHQVVLRRGEVRQVLVATCRSVATATAERLERFAREHGKRAEEAAVEKKAEPEKPEPGRKRGKRRKR